MHVFTLNESQSPMAYPSMTSLATGQVLLIELMSSGHISKTVPFLEVITNTC